MKINRIKFLALAIITIPLFVGAFLNSTNPQPYPIVKKDTEATYKNQCAACHLTNAEKFFDPAIADEALVEVILKGKKGANPPFMPCFEPKGMTAEQAKELVVYMRQLRAAIDSNSETSVTNVNATANTNSNANVDTNANADKNVNAETNANTICDNSNSAVNSDTNTNVNSTVEAVPDASAIAEAAATYKTKCMACHTAKAGKFFDTTKSEDQLIEAILKGRKGAKPPFMPEFDSKGVKPEQAKALVYYMRQLKVSEK